MLFLILMVSIYVITIKNEYNMTLVLFLFNNHNQMELPAELWNLIVYNLKFDLDLYKNGMLVNKQIYNVIKQLYEQIPNQLHVKTFYKNSVKISQDKMIDFNYSKAWLEGIRQCSIAIGDMLIMDKCELIKKNHCKFRYLYLPDFSQYGMFQLEPSIYLDDEMKQTCYNIMFKTSMLGFRLEYYREF